MDIINSKSDEYNFILEFTEVWCYLLCTLSLFCGDLSVRSLGQICMASSKCTSLALCSEIQNVNQAQRLQNKSH